MKKVDTIISSIFVACVGLLLVAPTLAQVFHLPGLASSEQRSSTPRPPVVYKQVLTGYHQQLYEKYLNDSFGLRSYMVRGLTDVYVDMFDTSPINRVLIGTDDWLFLNEKQLALDTQGVQTFTDAEVATLTEVFTTRAKYFDARGIPYVYVVVPNKQTIYPEYLPFDVSEDVSNKKTDQVIEIIKEHTNILVIDLREVLRDAKVDEAYPLYIPTDTHWQPYAAHIAHIAVMDQLSELYPELFSAYVPVERVPNPLIADGGDLARMLGKKFSYRDPFVLMPPAIGEEPTVAVPITAYENPTRDRYVAFEQTATANLPRAVVFRDSFGEALLPFVSEPFSRTAYMWSPFMYDYIIEAEEPDIVIQFMVERLMSQLLEMPSREGGF